jgi:hypothetical protein
MVRDALGQQQIHICQWESFAVKFPGCHWHISIQISVTLATPRKFFPWGQLPKELIETETFVLIVF